MRSLAMLWLALACGVMTSGLARAQTVAVPPRAATVTIPGAGTNAGLAMAALPSTDGGVTDAFLVALTNWGHGTLTMVGYQASDGGLAAGPAPAAYVVKLEATGIALRTDCDLDGDGRPDVVVGGATNGVMRLVDVKFADGSHYEGAPLSSAPGSGSRLACVSAAGPDQPGVLFAGGAPSDNVIETFVFTRPSQPTHRVVSLPAGDECGVTLAAWRRPNGQAVGVVGCGTGAALRHLLPKSGSADEYELVSGEALGDSGVRQFVPALDAVGSVTGEPGTSVAAADESKAVRVFGVTAQGTISRVASAPGTSGVVDDGVRRLGDVDGDGFADVAARRTNGSLMAIFGGTDAGNLPSTDQFGSLPCGATAPFRALERVGDLDRDGFADFAVACQDSDNITVIFGGPYLRQHLLSAGPVVPLGQWSGVLVAMGIGDITGDGRGDMLRILKTANTPTAEAYDLANGSSITLTLPQGAPDEHRESVAATGDLNGDGVADFVIGLPGESAVAVFYGSPGSTGLVGTPLSVPQAPLAGFGVAVGGVGDLDGDGYGDFAVAAGRAHQTGTLYVYRGGATGVDANPAWTWSMGPLTAPESVRIVGAGNWLGDARRFIVVAHDATLSILGVTQTGTLEKVAVDISSSQAPVGALDIDGDGRSEVLLHSAFSGAKLLSAGDPVGVALTNASSAMFIDAIGDFDGDGRDDVFAVQIGRGYLWGKPDKAPLSFLTGTGEIGAEVLALGDVNGDAYADFAIRAESGIHVFLGGASGPGRPLHLAQRIDAQPRGPGYVSSAASQATFEMDITDDVASMLPGVLEVEVEPVGTRFSGQPSCRSQPTASGIAAATMSLPAGSYHWRARTWSAGFVSRWRSFGANDESANDFTLKGTQTGAGGGDATGGGAGPGGGGGAEGGGDAGNGGGQVEGAGGGDEGPLYFVPQGCDCQAVSALPVGLWLALWGLSRRRRRSAPR